MRAAPINDRGSTLNPTPTAAEALDATNRHDWTLAAELWGAIHATKPADEDVALQLGQALRECLRFDEAESVLGTLDMRRRDVALHYAWIAQQRKDWAEALLRWERFRAVAPDHPNGYAAAAAALWELDRFDEAEALVAVGMRLAPHESMDYTSAWTASLQQNWDEALRRWRPLRIAHPDDLTPVVLIGRALIALGRYEDWMQEVLPEAERHPDRADMYEQIAHVGDQARPRDKIAREDIGAFAGRIECLGDNCEFGLVQRHFGTEPLGLLRWADIAVGDVIRALDQRFAGLGDDFSFVPGGANYFLWDKTYGAVMHTFVPVKDVPEQVFAVRMQQRLRFLADKLLDDLEDGEKIFIFKPRAGAMTDAEIADLAASFRRISRGRLLCVRLDPELYRTRVFEEIEPGLALGHLDVVSPHAHTDEISYASWEKLLNAVARHWG